MSEGLNRIFWDIIRPVHTPITRRLRRRLARNYFAHPEMDLPPPYEALQLDVERHLHNYLHVRPQEISQVIIVGAHEADEVVRLHDNYPGARFLCFEPNPDTHRRLVERFAGQSHVTISNFALGNAPGKARFYELDMPGNGSLLEPDVKDWAKFSKGQEKEAVSFEVDVSTLDAETKGMSAVDLLWMDVQGAEGRVLSGAAETLKRTRAVFLEVALTSSPYKGTALFSELAGTLQANQFTCVGLGVDAWNGSGNALFVRNFENLVCK